MSLEILEWEGRSVLIRVACDAGTYIRSLCHHMGLAAGPGGSMRELRRTRSGSFSESDAHSLQELEDAAYAAREGNPAPLQGMILPMERGVADLPRIIIRDTAVDALCHGALLAGVGVTKCRGDFHEQEILSGSSRRRASWWPSPSPAWAATPSARDTTGLVAAPRVVFMNPATYPRGWKKKRDRQTKG